MSFVVLVYAVAFLFLLSLSLLQLGNAESVVLNNRRPGLLPPPGGVWRGAELGSQFLHGTGGDTIGRKGDRTSDDPCAEKLASYHNAYPTTPLHVYRSFNLTVGPGVRDWVNRGGILWYNIKTDKKMSWEKGANGGFDAEARAWAAEVRSLAPAKVFVTIFHEADHNVCFVDCTKGGVPGNTPANYVGMWKSIQGVFRAEGVTNAIWVIDYSVQIGTSVAHMNDECSATSCYAASAVAPLYPGDDAVDWIFFNLFEKAKKSGVKADYSAMLTASMSVLRNVNVSGHCVGHCDLASKPWGLGAFASHGMPNDGKPAVATADRVKFLRDASAGMQKHPELRAYLYFDSLDSIIPLPGNGSEPVVEAAFQEYLASPQFAVGDAGAPKESV